jgi:hypothetical protein
LQDLEKYDLDIPINEKQHYVPVIYLKWFSKNWLIVVYDIKERIFINNWNPIYNKDICKKWDFYVAQMDNRKYSYAIEKILFSEFIEWNIESVINKLSKQQELNDFEHNVLASFISFQFTRTKKFKDQFESNRNQFYKTYSKEVLWFWWDFENFKETVKVYEQNTWNSIWNIEDFFETTNRISINVKESPEAYMKHMLEIWLNFSKFLLNCEIIIHHTRKNNLLITSDNPFYIIPPKGWKYKSWERINWIGFLKPIKARKIIHLSETLAVECFPHKFIPWGKIIHNFLNYKKTQILNSYIIKNAERFIMCSSKKNIDNVIKNINFKKNQDIKNIPNIKFFHDEQVIWNFWIYPL